MKVIEIEDGDVLVYKIGRNGMPLHSFSELCGWIKDSLKEVFPYNKIVVMNKEDEFDIIRSLDDR